MNVEVYSPYYEGDDDSLVDLPFNPFNYSTTPPPREPTGPIETFKFLGLPYVVSRIVFEQMDFKGQIYLSFFRKSARLLQKFPATSFEKLDSAGIDLIEIYVGKGREKVLLSTKRAEKLLKHRITSEKFEWWLFEGDKKAFLKLLTCHDESLSSLFLKGDMDQKLYDDIVKTSQWNTLKTFTQDTNREFEKFIIKPEDVCHLEKLSLKIEKLFEETWKGILKNFQEKKSTFRISTMEKLPYKKIQAWWSGNCGPSTVYKNIQLNLPVRIQEIKNDPDSILIFGVTSHKIGGTVCRRNGMDFQFALFWGNLA